MGFLADGKYLGRGHRHQSVSYRGGGYAPHALMIDWKWHIGSLSFFRETNPPEHSRLSAYDSNHTLRRFGSRLFFLHGNDAVTPGGWMALHLRIGRPYDVSSGPVLEVLDLFGKKGKGDLFNLRNFRSLAKRTSLVGMISFSARMIFNF